MIFFRVICFLQMLSTVYLCFSSLISLFKSGEFYFAVETSFFLLMASLSIFGITLYSNNYPDKPVVGRQKSVFNWLFLLNFLLLAFLFALFFSSYSQLQSVATLLGRSFFSLPVQLLLTFLIPFSLLAFQFIILYGLYTLRRKLYENFNAKQFEFETPANS